MPQSLRRRCLYISVINTNAAFGLGDVSGPTHIPDEVLPAARATLAKLVSRFASIFEQLPPTEGRQVGVKAVVLVFPDVPDADAPSLIDAVQFQCKVGRCGRAGWACLCAAFVSRGVLWSNPERVRETGVDAWGISPVR